MVKGAKEVMRSVYRTAACISAALILGPGQDAAGAPISSHMSYDPLLSYHRSADSPVAEDPPISLYEDESKDDAETRSKTIRYEIVPANGRRRLVDALRGMLRHEIPAFEQFTIEYYISGEGQVLRSHTTKDVGDIPLGIEGKLSSPMLEFGVPSRYEAGLELDLDMFLLGLRYRRGYAEEDDEMGNHLDAYLKRRF